LLNNPQKQTLERHPTGHRSAESGLVKTPRVVVWDDAALSTKDFRAKRYHLYADETVKSNINQAAELEAPLPDLVIQPKCPSLI
jgi:hypothetical protein